MAIYVRQPDGTYKELEIKPIKINPSDLYDGYQFTPTAREVSVGDDVLITSYLDDVVQDEPAIDGEVVDWNIGTVDLSDVVNLPELTIARITLTAEFKTYSNYYCTYRIYEDGVCVAGVSKVCANYVSITVSYKTSKTNPSLQTRIYRQNAAQAGCTAGDQVAARNRYLYKAPVYMEISFE